MHTPIYSDCFSRCCCFEFDRYASYNRLFVFAYAITSAAASIAFN